MEVATVTAKPGQTTAFPVSAVEANLRAALLEAVNSTVALHGIALPAATTDQYAAAVHIDSLVVVDLLCGVEPIVGFELNDSIVKPGGYKSIDEAIGHVMPRIESAWHKHAKKGAKK
jgi:hypothetical protein